MKPAAALLLLLITLLLRGEVRSCTPAELRAHLTQLKSVAVACEQKPAWKACNPAKVGPDDKVGLPGGPRLIRYDWLRLAMAESSDKHKACDGLKAAPARLNTELKDLASAGPVAPAEVARDRSELTKILSSGDFPPPQGETPWDRWWDSFLRWLNRALETTLPSGTHTNWAGVILIGVVTLAACGGLLWWFRRATRRRYLLPEGGERGTAHRPDEQVDWRAWLDEAQGLAAEERWRESIHRVYWAAVARLESRGLWRHDPARTPREYLRLLAVGSPQRGDLASLTRSLELFWYGGQTAGQRDYLRARELLERLAQA